jgi:iron complex outermembrane receptor protein
LSTHAVNVDYKKHCTTDFKGFNTSIQNNFANPATGIKPLIPNFDRVEFGAYGIASYDLSDSFR